MEHLNLLTAFLAGIISFLSPCVLPLVPAYMSFISGISFQDMTTEGRRTGELKRIMLKSIVFILGFSFVFVLLGATATYLGRFLLSNMHIITKIAGVVIIIFGLHTARVFQIPFLNYEKRFHTSGSELSYIGTFTLGLAFAFGWSPCIGPILAAILAIASVQHTVLKGVYLLFLYSLGLGIPFFLTGIATNSFLRLFSGVKKHFKTVEIVSGIFLIVIGVMFFFNWFTILSSLFVRWFPWLIKLG
ncbi:thiol:disulfide interchange protein DsbD precursor [bacterium BMS3Abin05]|nr:thiol:disulfide interchange protein DsbD precursor [bacterium BMS3Abin05]GBE26522.1 thiol:disulfide interchange protein DsbD precursor [bacterium BMS3Bbin03]